VLSTRAAVQRGLGSDVADVPPTIIAPAARRPQATVGAKSDPRAVTPMPTVALKTPASTVPPPAVTTTPAPAATKTTGAGAATGRRISAKAPAPPRPRRDYAAELRASATRATAPLRAAWAARTARERTLIAAVAAGVIVVVALLAVLLTRPPAVAPTGAVALDAVPWATITRIEAEDGTVQPLPAEMTTPMMLTLPVGTYRVTFTGPPPDSESRVVTVSVQENGTATADVARFQTLSAEDYFEQYLTSSATPPDAAGAGAPPVAGQPPVPGSPGASTAPQAGTADGARP
jgi:hypothetical protein